MILSKDPPISQHFLLLESLALSNASENFFKAFVNHSNSRILELDIQDTPLNFNNSPIKYFNHPNFHQLKKLSLKNTGINELFLTYFFKDEK